METRSLLLLLYCRSVVVAMIGEDEFCRHSMTCLTRPVVGSSTVLDQTGTQASSLDQVDLRWSSDVDLAASRDQGLAAHHADTRYDRPRYFLCNNRLHLRSSEMRPNNELCNAVVTDGTNQSHSINETYNVHIQDAMLSS